MTSQAKAKSGGPSPRERPRYSLVVPVYNEAENIASFCRALAQLPPGYEVLICHDFEGDNTLAAFCRLPQEQKPSSVRFILNSLGPGVRYAIEAGIREAVAPVVVVTMADASGDFSRVEEMVSRIEAGADVVCASRYMPGGRQIGGPRIKSLLSRVAGLSLHRFSGLPTREPTNSFKAYSREFLRRTRIESPAGFALAMELTVKAHFSGGRVERCRRPGEGERRGQAAFVSSLGCLSSSDGISGRCVNGGPSSPKVSSAPGRRGHAHMMRPWGGGPNRRDWSRIIFRRRQSDH